MEQDLTESPAPELEAPVEVLSPEDYVMGLVKSAKKAAGRLSALSTAVKNQALEAMAEGLEAHEAELLAENEKDLEQFDATPERKALGDRLRLTAERIRDMAAGIRDVARLPDPLGEMPKMWTRPNGMQVGRMRVPLGVIGIIYEARPNVTADSAAHQLCGKITTVI